MNLHDVFKNIPFSELEKIADSGEQQLMVYYTEANGVITITRWLACPNSTPVACRDGENCSLYSIATIKEIFG